MYDLADAQFTKEGKLYTYVQKHSWCRTFASDTAFPSLDVPGLAEKRPSVVIGASPKKHHPWSISVHPGLLSTMQATPSKHKQFAATDTRIGAMCTMSV